MKNIKEPPFDIEIEDILTELLEYMEDREDIEDGDYGSPIANKEMKLAIDISKAIWRIELEKKVSAKLCKCTVPNNLHGTACGWLNAAYCIEPKNNEEKLYKLLWEEAHPNIKFTNTRDR